MPLALDEDGVTPEEVQLVHLLLAKANDRVLVCDRVLDNEAVGSVLTRTYLRRGVTATAKMWQHMGGRGEGIGAKEYTQGE